MARNTGVVLAFAAVLGIAAMSLASSDGIPVNKTGGDPPDSVVDRITEALATNDPEVMRALAAELDQQGWQKQAAALRWAADTTAAALAAGVTVPTIPPSAVAKPLPGPVVFYPLPTAAPAPSTPHITPGRTSGPANPIQKPPRPAVILRPAAPPRPHVAPPPVVPVVPLARVLKQGVAGNDVKGWQMLLTSAGYDIGPKGADGDFGTRTVYATQAWQAARWLKADGIVGKDTLANVSTPPRPITPSNWPELKQVGGTSTPAHEWQLILVRDGYMHPTKVDGAFGPGTKAATIAWQRARGVTPNGVVSADTRAHIAPGRLPVEPHDGAIAIAGDEPGDSGSGFDVIGDLEQYRDGLGPQPSTPLPGVVAPMDPAPPPPAERALAARVAMMLLNQKPGSEDKELVERFQVQENQKPTGMYGPAVGLALARYGIVPPPPYYWTETGRKRTKQKYREALMALSNADPQRADEWAHAALVR